MTNGGSVAFATVCPLGRWTGLVWAPVFFANQAFLVLVALIPLDSIQYPWVLEPAHLPGSHLHWKAEGGLGEREHGGLRMLLPAVPCGFSAAW